MSGWLLVVLLLLGSLVFRDRQKLVLTFCVYIGSRKPWCGKGDADQELYLLEEEEVVNMGRTSQQWFRSERGIMVILCL